jgi:hypothetical protein
MDDTRYIVIKTTEDGIYIESYTKEELLEEMDEQNWDEDAFCQVLPSSDNDPQCWGTTTTVIKGKVVVPEQVAISIHYEVE